MGAPFGKLSNEWEAVVYAIASTNQEHVPTGMYILVECLSSQSFGHCLCCRLRQVRCSKAVWEF